MQVPKIQGRHFLRKKSPCGTLHNITKGLVPLFAAIFRYLPLSSAICRYLPLFAAICRYLLLFAVSLSAICRYLPLAFPLFAANYSKLQLFAANYDYRKLPIRVI